MIDSYDFGTIKISGKTYKSDVIIYPDRVDGKWWRKEGHSLHPDDLRVSTKSNVRKRLSSYLPIVSMYRNFRTKLFRTTLKM
ncbi:MAG: hypothetical protein ABRQ39_24360 [Candidatus Eremiobacterota bacterium]